MNYLIKDCITYQNKIWQPGQNCDFANLNKKQISALIEAGVIETIKETKAKAEKAHVPLTNTRLNGGR